MANLDVMYTSNKDDWETPIEFFNKCNDEFKFTLDGAANEQNHLLPIWLGPGSTISHDALSIPWGKARVWLNPPYSMCAEFTAKAALEWALNGAFTVMLIPSRTDTKYWHKWIWNSQLHHPWGDVRIRFIKGRLKFTQPGMVKQNSAPFPSALILFGEP